MNRNRTGSDARTCCGPIWRAILRHFHASVVLFDHLSKVGPLEELLAAVAAGYSGLLLSILRNFPARTPQTSRP